MTMKKEAGIEHTEFFIRNHKNIDDFIYDAKSNTSLNISNKKALLF